MTERRPRVPANLTIARRCLRRVSLASSLVVLAVALAACGGERGESCNDESDCRSGLTCMRHAWPVAIDGDRIRLGPQKDVPFDGVPFDVPGICITRDDSEVIGEKIVSAWIRACQNADACVSRFCQDLGTTTVHDPTRDPIGLKCIAATDEECRRAPTCKINGNCRARDGFCSADEAGG